MVEQQQGRARKFNWCRHDGANQRHGGKIRDVKKYRALSAVHPAKSLHPTPIHLYIFYDSRYKYLSGSANNERSRFSLSCKDK